MEFAAPDCVVLAAPIEADQFGEPALALLSQLMPHPFGAA
jgi:hypothetical protein